MIESEEIVASPKVLPRIAIAPVLPVVKKIKQRQSFSEIYKNYLKNIPTRLDHSKQSILENISAVRGIFTLPKMRVAIACLLVLTFLPFPAIGYYKKVHSDSERIIADSANAFLSLQSSTLSALNTNIDQATFDLDSALQSFQSARALLEDEHSVLVSLAKLLPGIGAEIQSRESILVAGHNIALGNAYLLKGVQAVQQEGSGTVADRAQTFVYHIRGALNEYDKAMSELAQVDMESLPTEYQDMFKDVRLVFSAIVNDAHDMVELFDGVRAILGGDGVKTYLIIGQNSHELRATGGFMGSYALITVQQGKIQRVEVPAGGTYDVQGQLDVFVKPPLPLQVINKRWEMQDANWFPDFSASAEKTAWFYEKSRKETVDGVIAVNASLLDSIATIFGSNILAGATNASESVVTNLETAIATERASGSNKPKAILGGVVEQLRSAFESSDPVDVARLLAVLSKALHEKDIQIYLRDANLQKQAEAFGWTGNIVKAQPNQDYLNVNISNIGGGKSDARIKQSLDYQVSIQADGRALAMLTIIREHNGDDTEAIYSEPNTAFVRAYVPLGAKLLAAQGFDFPAEDLFLAPERWYADDVDLAKYEKELLFDPNSGTRITNEFGKTVFGNWMSVSPGEKKEVTLVYELPFSLLPEKIIKNTQQELFDKFAQSKPAARYSLIVQKQSGINSDLNTSVIYPEGWLPVWRSQDMFQLARNGAFFHDVLSEDLVLGLVVEKQ